MAENKPERVALITGASGDIGGAIAAALAGAGWATALLARRVDRLDQQANTLRAAGTRCLCLATDLGDDEAIGRAAARMTAEFGRLDLLVHAAAIFERAPHAQAAITDLDHLYRSNVRGPYLLTQKLLPLLRAAAGQIVFINSTAGLSAQAETGQYSATQHAQRAIADALRSEVNSEDVRVLSLHLGRTASEGQRRIFALEGRAYSPEALMQPEDVAQMVLAAVQLPRSAEVTEIRMRPARKSY